MTYGKATEEVPHVRIEVSRGGYSVGKAMAANALVGTPGLVAGAGGRRRESWACRECGFGHTYGM